MKKLFGILGSVVLCAVMACVALTGCGDKTPKMEVVREWAARYCIVANA